MDWKWSKHQYKKITKLDKLCNLVIKDDLHQSYLETYLVTFFVLVSVQNDIGVSTEEFTIIFFRPIFNLEKVIHIFKVNLRDRTLFV